MQMKRFDTINVIPLIDVMLVLLAIVLTTASFIVHDALNLDLPETQSTQSYQPNPDQPALKFSIDGNNALFLDETPMAYDQLDTLLKSIETERAIVIKVDKAAQFEYFVKLIDALKLKELNNLTILTQAQ